MLLAIRLSIVPAVLRPVITGRHQDDVDEVLNSDVAKSYALVAPGEAWARHGVEHPLGADFSGMQDLSRRPSTSRRCCPTQRKSRPH
jgi:hypothetical protein